MKEVFKTVILMMLVTLINMSVDISGLGYGLLTAYAEQVSEVEEGSVSYEAESSDASSESPEESNNDAPEEEAEDDSEEQADSSDTVSSDDSNDKVQAVEADASEVKSDDKATAVEAKAESFELGDKTGSVKELEFSRPERKTETETETETEKETVTETEPESVPETVKETEPETVPETTAPETVPEATIPETVPETVPETTSETQPETEAEQPKKESHQSKGGSGSGGSTSHDNSSMNWLNNKPVDVPVVETVSELQFPEASATPVVPTSTEEMVLTASRSVPKTGEDNMFMLLVATGTVFLLCGLLLDKVERSGSLVFVTNKEAKNISIATLKEVMLIFGTCLAHEGMLYFVLTFVAKYRFPLGLVITWAGKPLLWL